MARWACLRERGARLVFLVCFPFILSLRSNLAYSLAAMGATFAFTESFVANQREKNDALNGAIGGCAAGFLAGIKSSSFTKNSFEN